MILDYETMLRILIEKITSNNMVRIQNYRFDVQGFIIDWVRRGLLDIIFDNSDDHRCNTAFMKADNEITLTSIYNFTPMKADPRGTPHTMKWLLTCESKDEYNFGAIA